MTDSTDGTDDEDKKKSKDKTDYEKANQKGAVSPADERVFEFLDSLFVDEKNFPEFVEVRQVKGKNFDQMGETVKKYVFTSAAKPSRERIAAISNDVVLRIRIDVDVRNKETMYHIAAKNPQLGAEFYDRILYRGQPKGTWKNRGSEFGINGEGEQEEEEVAISVRRDMHRLDADKEMFALMGSMLNGLIDRADKQANSAYAWAEKMQDKFMQSLEANIQLVRRDAEMREKVESDKIKNKALSAGVDFATALLPPMLSRFTGKHSTAWQPGHESADAVTIRVLFDVSETAKLTPEQQRAIFGVPEQGFAGGILAPAQSNLLANIADKTISPDALDLLLIPNGPLEINQEQFMALGQIGVPMTVLGPLKMLFDGRIRAQQEAQKAQKARQGQ